MITVAIIWLTLLAIIGYCEVVLQTRDTDVLYPILGLIASIVLGITLVILVN